LSAVAGDAAQGPARPDDEERWLIAPALSHGSCPAGFVMSGRRSLIKGYFRFCAGRGCGHVFGLFVRRMESAGPDVVR
jgi:hypothetical protein